MKAFRSLSDSLANDVLKKAFFYNITMKNVYKKSLKSRAIVVK